MLRGSRRWLLSVGVLASSGVLVACGSSADTSGPTTVVSSGQSSPTPAPTAPSSAPPTSYAPETTGPSSATVAPSNGDPGQVIHYVALGDSYVSAPGLPPAADGDVQCARSASNYPHLVAASDPRISLVDESCNGAPTGDVIERQSEPLSADTDLVTLGIGGNDGRIYDIFLGTCLSLWIDHPNGSPCADSQQAALDRGLDEIGRNVEQTLQVINQKAPNARVLVVGYPQLLPDSGTCVNRIGLAPGDYAFVNAGNARMNDALELAAKNNGDTYLDVATPSVGHDICSSDPWINGKDDAPNGVFAFHPFAAEQDAVAAMVEGYLGQVG